MTTQPHMMTGDFRSDAERARHLEAAVDLITCWMVDGPDKAHEWSEKQRRNEYDAAITDAKLNGFKGPHTCGKIALLSGAPCGSCPHYHETLSPVRLGEGGVPAQHAARRRHQADPSQGSVR